MPADLTKPFADSCCDGGAGSCNEMSAQPCGCDPGANWVCQKHKDQQSIQVIEKITRNARVAIEENEAKFFSEVSILHDNKKDILGRHLTDVVLKTWNFSGRLETKKDHEINALVGLASEAGETLDIGKKMWYHTEKDFNSIHRPALVKELGDVIYYLLVTLNVFGISLDEVLEMNREKLESRHPELQKVQVRFQEGYIK